MSIQDLMEGHYDTAIKMLKEGLGTPNKSFVPCTRVTEDTQLFS